jgi:hypothetical protein
MADVWNVIAHDYSRDAAWLREQHFVKEGTEPNIEAVLAQVQIASRDAERRRATADGVRLSQVLHRLRRAVVRAAIRDEALWLRPDQTIINPHLAHHIRLLARLVGNRQPGHAAPWVFTSNYDLPIEWAAEALGLHVVNLSARWHSCEADHVGSWPEGPLLRAEGTG